jgi:hypothetical protein
MPSRDQIPVEQLAAWAAQYGRSERQIRRYLEEGEAAGDPCPLNDPIAFREWWPRHKKWRTPDWLLAAAESCGGVARPSAPVSESIDLASHSLEEGEAVRQARKLVGALWQQLERAYRENVGSVDGIQKKYEKAMQLLASAERADREDAKQRRLLVDRVKVQRDINTATEVLRQMRASMERRVLERLPELAPEVKRRIADIIGEVREQEDGVFRQLPTLKGLDDVSRLLAA